MDIRVGSRWKSTVCSTQVIVVRPPKGPLDLGCGGSPLVPIDDETEPTGAPAPGLAGGTEIGKRYGGEELELLCTQSGAGTLTADGEPVPMKAAKALPASD